MAKKNEIVSITIPRPDGALFSRSKASLSAAKGFEISTPEDAEDAGAILREIKGTARELEEKRTSITKPINQALREINALFKPAKAWLADAEQHIKGKLLAYQNEQARIARELQAEADALAAKEQAKLDRRAAKAEAKGKAEKAEALRKVAETTIAPVIETAAPKLSGIATREIWKAEITDQPALVKHIAIDQNELLYLIKIDQSALNALARRLKSDLDLPGVKAVSETSLAARAN